MRAIFVLMFTLLLIKTSYSQHFTLGPKGFVSKDNKDYVVVEVPGATHQTLYDNILKSINSLYSNPQKGLTLVSGQSITLSAYQKRAVKLSGGIMSYDYDVDYTLSFLFKDGKIRVNSPTFDAGFMNYNGTWNTLKVERTFFKSNGEVKGEKNHQQINSYFNGLIASILDKSAKIDNW